MSRIILTCNAGSTNTKLAAYDAANGEKLDHTTTRSEKETTDWLATYQVKQVAAVGHRVVHGGREFTAPVAVDDAVMNALKTLIPLAPLHQPAALALIDVMRKQFPDVPQVACFDSAFHHTMTEQERRLPLPRELHEEGVVRYGFHGLSYEYIAMQLPKHIQDAHTKRIVVAHLGGGSSACAMKGLKSVASTMGFSTLDGLMMGTRPGALDAGVVLYLMQQKHMPAEDISRMLYTQSGVKGVSGISGEMKALLESESSQAKEAVELYCYLAAKQIAGLLVALNGLDALVFTGGIGEHAAPVRDRIISHLAWVGEFAVYILPTDEEAVLFSACKQSCG